MQVLKAISDISLTVKKKNIHVLWSRPRSREKKFCPRNTALERKIPPHDLVSDFLWRRYLPLGLVVGRLVLLSWSSRLAAALRNRPPLLAAPPPYQHPLRVIPPSRSFSFLKVASMQTFDSFLNFLYDMVSCIKV